VPIRGSPHTKLQWSKTQTPSMSNLNRIGEHSIWSKFGSRRYEGSRDAVWPENVKDSLAGGDQIIRNDPPMTSHHNVSAHMMAHRSEWPSCSNFSNA
jgi:hypothetical protein